MLLIPQTPMPHPIYSKDLVREVNTDPARDLWWPPSANPGSRAHAPVGEDGDPIINRTVPGDTVGTYVHTMQVPPGFMQGVHGDIEALCQLMLREMDKRFANVGISKNFDVLEAGYRGFATTVGDNMWVSPLGLLLPAVTAALRPLGSLLI